MRLKLLFENIKHHLILTCFIILSFIIFYGDKNVDKRKNNYDKGKVYAYGYSEQIQKAFSDCIKDDITRLPLSLGQVKGNPILKTLVIKTLICGLASVCKKEAAISKRLIWDKSLLFKNFKKLFTKRKKCVIITLLC